MKGVYIADVKIAGVTSGNPRTLAYLTAPGSKVVELLNVSLTQENNATNFQLVLDVSRISTLGTPTGYSNPTIVKTEPGDQASGSTFAAGSSSSTEPTTYSDQCFHEGGPSLAGVRFEPNSPDERIYVAPGASVGFRIYNASGTSTDYDIKVVWKEIG